MKAFEKFKPFLFTLITLGIVIGGSIAAKHIWPGKPEKQPEKIVIEKLDGLSAIEFAKKYKIPNPVLKNTLGIKDQSELKNPMNSFGVSKDKLEIKLNMNMAIYVENASKNWTKIRLKFALWIAYLILVFFLVRAKLIKSTLRKWLYIIAVVIFGIILGSDPSPMGTVKDAIVLFGTHKVLFVPRLIALGIFILLVVVANKFICSWGCQLGTLQDLLFRFNRNKKDTKGIIRQIKVPFVVSNSIRFVVFIAIFVFAFVWAFDLVGAIDPFKVFAPEVLGIAGIVFVAVILLLSLFVYRPWCTFLCPFGFVGWIFEKISIFKIHVDYDKCTSCGVCEKACPTTVMSAILRRDKKTIPDCFSCATCIETCPVDAISLKSGKRKMPPKDKFAK